ncbi:MAG: hypothetical protein IRY93_05945 [Chthoniobacterales bacterium]|jgi:hypothetical protein|nr:hypothetical protein [Chthoniobacterales bacterium]
MADGKSNVQAGFEPGQLRRMTCQGWISLAGWIVFGLLIEGLIGFRAPALMDDPVRREMFRLAHAHGTLLNLVLIAAAICARLGLIRLGRSTALGLRTAVIILPAGFLLAGLWHFKDDPGVAIFLVPLGALLLLATAFRIGLSGCSG